MGLYISYGIVLMLIADCDMVKMVFLTVMIAGNTFGIYFYNVCVVIVYASSYTNYICELSKMLYSSIYFGCHVADTSLYFDFPTEIYNIQPIKGQLNKFLVR